MCITPSKAEGTSLEKMVHCGHDSENGISVELADQFQA